MKDLTKSLNGKILKVSFTLTSKLWVYKFLSFNLYFLILCFDFLLLSHFLSYFTLTYQ